MTLEEFIATKKIVSAKDWVGFSTWYDQYDIQEHDNIHLYLPYANNKPGWEIKYEGYYIVETPRRDTMYLLIFATNSIFSSNLAILEEKLYNYNIAELKELLNHVGDY